LAAIDQAPSKAVPIKAAVMLPRLPPKVEGMVEECIMCRSSLCLGVVKALPGLLTGLRKVSDPFSFPLKDLQKKKRTQTLPYYFILKELLPILKNT
jgi:hypothetical protein